MAQFVSSFFLYEWFWKQDFFEFEWDEGNTFKSKVKHGIDCTQAESVFTSRNDIQFLGKQIAPPVDEDRYGIFGITMDSLYVFVCFTIRGSRIRIISIRKMNNKEKQIYETLCQK